MILEHLLKVQSNFTCETISIGPKSAYVLKFNFLAPPAIDNRINPSEVEEAPTEILDLGDGPTVKSESHNGNTVSSLSQGDVQKHGDRELKDNTTGTLSNAREQDSGQTYSSNDDSDAEYSESDSSYSDSESNEVEEYE